MNNFRLTKEEIETLGQSTAEEKLYKIREYIETSAYIQYLHKLPDEMLSFDERVNKAQYDYILDTIKDSDSNE